MHKKQKNVYYTKMADPCTAATARSCGLQSSIVKSLLLLLNLDCCTTSVAFCPCCSTLVSIYLYFSIIMDHFKNIIRKLQTDVAEHIYQLEKIYHHTGLSIQGLRFCSETKAFLFEKCVWTKLFKMQGCETRFYRSVLGLQTWGKGEVDPSVGFPCVIDT